MTFRDASDQEQMGQHVPVKWSTLTFPLFYFPCLPLTRSSFPPSLCLEVPELHANVDPTCFVLFISNPPARICRWTAEGDDHILLLNFCSYTRLLYFAFMTSIKVLNSYLMKLRLSRHLPIGFYGCIHSGTMKKKWKSITVDGVIEDDELLMMGSHPVTLALPQR